MAHLDVAPTFLDTKQTPDSQSGKLASQPVKASDIDAAYERLKAGKIHHVTPLTSCGSLDLLVNHMAGDDPSRKYEIRVKSEFQQRGGAFKIRGAYNMISKICSGKTDDEMKNMVFITHSSGNHGQAVAIAAAAHGAKAKIVAPAGATQAKLNAMKGYGAEIVSCENTGAARSKACDELEVKLKKEGKAVHVIPSCDAPEIIAGQGTVAKEIIEAWPEVQAIIVPVGGGGLLSGTLIAAKSSNPKIKVIGVEPAAANDAIRSLKAKKQLMNEPPVRTICDGAKTDLFPKYCYPIISDLADALVTVTEVDVSAAVCLALERAKAVIEPTGCLSISSLFTDDVITYLEQNHIYNVCVVASGGNVDLKVIGECHNLASKSRLNEAQKTLEMQSSFAQLGSIYLPYER